MVPHDWGCGDLPAMGAVFYLGAGHSGSPWIFQAPTFHLRQQVNLWAVSTTQLSEIWGAVLYNADQLLRIWALSKHEDNVWIHMFNKLLHTNSILNPCSNWACIVVWLQWQQHLFRYSWLPKYFYNLKYLINIKCLSFIYRVRTLFCGQNSRLIPDHFFYFSHSR